ncbi:hypothetical protein [Flavobacterium hiemivividum]|uniref:Uncharacterized protein n=1 Tax=Flavobacterium hiemivividum TaxID=2541734 RepID=A0A4R5D8D8_9FLAO|nr:hypothetical protein [Flavobacterium hiemivividum]TDE06775.1 hypothetical protein E0F98_03935 [Flavobacterium hiemivividum]
MKLTAQQIALIDETLVLNGLKYDDIKLEIMDHIASEIEFEMEENSLSFEENSRLVFKKWEPQLKPANSFFTGINNSYPKIVLDKKITLLKKQLFTGFLISATVLFIFLVFKEYYNAQFLTYQFQKGGRLLYIIGYFLLIVYTFKIWKSKLNTSFNHLFKTRVITYLFYIYPIIFFTTPTTINNQVLLVIVESLMLFHLLLSLQLVKKHFQFEKKLSISKS